MAKVTIHVALDDAKVKAQIAELDAKIRNKKAEINVIANTDAAKAQYGSLIASIQKELKQVKSMTKSLFSGKKGDAEAWSKYAVEKVDDVEDRLKRLENTLANIGRESSSGLKEVSSHVSSVAKELDTAATSADKLATAMGTVATASKQIQSVPVATGTASSSNNKFFNQLYSRASLNQLSSILNRLSAGDEDAYLAAYHLTRGSLIDYRKNALPTTNGLAVYDPIFAAQQGRYRGTGFTITSPTYGSVGGASAQVRTRFPINDGSVIYMTGGGANGGEYSYIGNQGRPQILALPEGRDWYYKGGYNTRLEYLQAERMRSMPSWRDSYSGERGQLGDDIVDWKEYNKNITEATKNTGFFEQVLGTSLGNYVLRLSTYQMVSSAIYGTVEAFHKAMETMKKVDTELASIQKVTDFSAEQMEVIEQGAYKTASKYGVEAQEYLESVSAFAKAGYRDLADELGELAIKTQLVGDVTATTANQFLLSVDAAWKMNGSVTDLSRVLDEANVVENNYATSIDKLAQGMPNVASVAAMAGMSAEQTIAALGTITAVTQQSGQKAATALRALILNIMRDTTTEVEEGVTVTKEQISTLDEVIQEYAADVVDAANKTGKIVNPMEVVAALAKAYQENRITERDLSKIEMALGGKLRTNQLDALLKNFYGSDGEEGMYEGMMNKIASAAGSADKEIGIMLDTWDAKAKILQNTWTEFLSKTISTDMFKGILDSATKLLNVVGNLGTALEAVGGIFAAKFLFNAPERIGKISEKIADLFNLIRMYRDSAREDGAGFLDILFKGDSAKKIGAILAGISTAITVAVIAIQRYKQAVHDAATESFEKAQESQKESENLLALYSAYQKTAEGSEDQKEASRQLAVALGYEGDAVDSLVGKYQELTAAKLQENTSVAAEASALAGKDLETTYFWSGGKAAIRYTDLALSRNYSNIDNLINESLASVGQFRDGHIYAKDNSREGLVAYYDTLLDTINLVREETRTLSKEQRDEVFSSKKYMDLLQAEAFLREPVNAYKESIKNETISEAIENAQGIVKSQQSFEVYRETLKRTIEDEETLKSTLEILDSAFPQFASKVDSATNTLNENANAANEATNALERYKKALSDGGEKNDKFNAIIDAAQKMGEAGKNGYFGSNAFQEGAKLAFGEDYASSHSGEEIVKHYEKLQKMGVFDKDSMGRGLKNLITSSDAAEVEGNLTRIRDAAGEVIAEISDNGDGTFGFDITNTEAGLGELERILGVSKEHIIAMQEAMGMFDASINVDNLNAQFDGIFEKEEELAKPVDIPVNANTRAALEGLASVESARSALDGSSADVTVNIHTNGEFPSGFGGRGAEGDNTTPQSATGTSSFKGGLTWVNDEKGGFNPELIETGGKSFFVNGGRPALVSLPKGTVIHNATETRKLFAQDFTEVPHYESGTVPDYTGIGTRSGRVTGIGGGKGSASSKDWWEKLQQYMEDLLEKAGDALDKQLEAIDAELFYLQYGKEVSEKATKLEEARMDLLEAEQELINAQTERTVRYFNAETGQWEWMADQKDIIKAQEELAERQKDYLKAQYDYLEDVWNELKDDIQKAIDGKKDVNIANVLKQMLKSKAGGLTGNVEGLIGDLLNLITAFSNGTALDTYDSGGIANGLGYMYKATRADEVVLNGKLSNSILSPKRSQQFADFTSSLERMFGMSSMMERPKSMAGFSTTDSHNNIVYMNGIKIGSDMLNKPLSEVLSVLPIYCN